ILFERLFKRYALSARFLFRHQNVPPVRRAERTSRVIFLLSGVWRLRRKASRVCSGPAYPDMLPSKGLSTAADDAASPVVNTARAISPMSFFNSLMRKPY